MKIRIEINNLGLYLFILFYCYFFAFSAIFPSMYDEVIIIILLPFLFLLSGRRFSVSRYDVPLIMMYFVILAWSTEMHKSFLYFFILLEVLLFSNIVFRDIDLIFRVVKRTAIINSFFVLISRLFPNLMIKYAYLVFPPNVALGYEKAIGMNQYPGINYEAGFAALYICLGLFIYYFKDNKSLSDRCIIFFLLLSLIVTNKRAPLVYFFAVLFIVYIIKNGNRNRLGRIIVVAFLSALVVGMTVFVARFFPTISVFRRITEIYIAIQKKSDLNNALSGRVAIYNQAVSLFKSNRIWGIGWQNFADYSRFISSYGGVNQAHNVFIQLLCEMGIVGFSIVLLINLFYIIKTYHITNSMANVIRLNRTGLSFNYYEVWYIARVALAFMSIYYLVWFSGNAIYDYELVYSWLISVMIIRLLERERASEIIIERKEAEIA